MRLSKALLIFSIFASVNCDFDENVDESKVVCEAMTSSKESSFKVSSLKQPMSYEDVLKLVSWNMKFDLKSGSKEFNLPDVKWRRPIINEIFGIFKKGCPNDIVPYQFLNILKEFVMIYYNSLEKKTDNSAKWKNMMKVLKECKEMGHPLPVMANGLKAHSINIDEEGVVNLHPPMERADSIPAVDLIIDNLWWIFSFSFGSCYSPAGYRSSWAPRYKKLFFDDFIVPFMSRWGNVGPMANFGVIFGNFDLSTVLDNVRHCVTSTYAALGIEDRQLVRPLKIETSRTSGTITNFRM